MDQVFKEPEPLLAPWLDEECYAVLQAEHKAGKTWTALGIAAAVASGGTFCGGQATRARTVVYVDAENGEKRMQRRLQVLATDPGIDVAAINKNLVILGSREHDIERGAWPMIDGGEGSQAYVEYAQATGAELMIFDTKAKLVPGGENDKEDDDNLSTLARDLQRIGCAVLILHHIGKGRNAFDSKAARGSSALPASADLVLGLKKQSKACPDSVACFRLATVVGRDGDDGLDTRAELMPTGADAEMRGARTIYRVPGYRWMLNGRATDDDVESPFTDTRLDDAHRLIDTARAGHYPGRDKQRLRDDAGITDRRQYGRVVQAAIDHGLIEHGDDIEALRKAPAETA